MKVFVIGKGGVGKTTCSSAIAIGLSERYKTIIASLDPAHNLGDVLMTKLGNKPKKVVNNLYAIEADIDFFAMKYLKELEKSLKNVYRYLSVINLEKYFEILRYSPGIEEFSVLEAIKEVIRSNFSAFVFDTPPTGLTLRILTTPKTTLIWLKKLIELRRMILDRRSAIEKIQGKILFKIEDEKIEIPTRENDDAVIKELIKYKNEIEEIQKIFTDKDTYVIGVLNPDKLSFLEMKRAKDVLDKLDIELKMIIVNKVSGDVSLSEIKRKFETDVRLVKLRDREIRGIQNLRELYDEIEGIR